MKGCAGPASNQTFTIYGQTGDGVWKQIGSTTAAIPNSLVQTVVPVTKGDYTNIRLYHGGAAPGRA